MHQSEFCAVFCFLLFWFFIYSAEFRVIVVWIKNKRFPHSWRAYFVQAVALVGLLCLAYGYFIEPYWLDVRHIDIQSDKLSKASLTVVQISDLHCDAKIRNEEKLVQAINALNPDVIVFTGDSLNTHKALPLFRKTLAALKATYGKFAVRGNFDVWPIKDPRLFDQTGFEELDGDVFVFEKEDAWFSIAGLSVDYNLSEMGFFKKVDERAYNIFLYHYPGIHEDIPFSAPVDLFLSGHTHGGQIAVPFYGAIITLSKYGKRYEKGSYTLDKSMLYVNRGIGMEGGMAPRIRFWARPEVTVFHIEPGR